MNEKKKLQPKVRFREFTGENAPDWEQRKLGEMSSFSKGSGYTKNDLTSAGTPIVLYGRLYTDYHTVIRHINTLVRLKEGSVISEGGEVIIPASGETALDIARASVVEKPGVIIGGDLNIVKVNKEIIPSFLAIMISNGSRKKELAKKAQGKSIVHIHNSDLKLIEIIYPTVNEQEKIWEFFNTLDKLITLHQRKLEQLEQLKNTLLSKMFPKSGTNIPEIRFSGFTDAWKQRKLGEVVNRFDNLRIPITESSRISGSTPYYGANGIQDYVEGYTHDGEYILIAEDGANDINNYPVFRVHGKIWVNNHAHVLQTIGDIADNDYVAYALKSINIGPYLVGGSRPKLNADSLMKLEIKLPKLSEQIKIGKIFLRIDYQIENYSQKLKNLKTAKKSLLDKLFI